MKKRFLFHRSEMTVALMVGATLISKALGLLRQMMTASIFGASMEGIAFSAASGIPLAIFDMLFSTAILGSFLPIYRGHLVSDGKRARSFSSSFLTVVFLLTGAASLLGTIFAGSIIRLAAPDLDENTLALAVLLLRIMFPSMIFAGAAYVLIGILQSHDRFLLPAFVSAVSNLIILWYLVLCSEPIGISDAIGLAFAYLFSWAVQFLTLAVPLLKKREFPGFGIGRKITDTSLALKRAIPVMFGSWLIPMTTLIAKALASFAEIKGEASGAAIVVYENAFSVYSIAAGILTYGICNYLFPKLSACFSMEKKEAFSELVSKGFFAAMAVSLPVSGVIFLLSDEIVGLLYLRGNFTHELAQASAVALRVLAFAIPAYSMTEFFSRVCYSSAEVKYPAIAAWTGISVSSVLGFLFLRMEAISVPAVALSVLFGQTAAGVLLLIFTRRFLVPEGARSFVKYGSLLLGYLLCMASMWVCRDFLRNFLHFSDTFQNFLIIALVFTVGFMVYSIWLVIVKIIDISKFRAIGGNGNISFF